MTSRISAFSRNIAVLLALGATGLAAHAQAQAEPAVPGAPPAEPAAPAPQTPAAAEPPATVAPAAPIATPLPASATVPAPPVAAIEEEPAGVELSGAPGKGFTASFGDDFSINLRSRIQIRYQLDAPADGPALQTANIGTARVWLSGHALTKDLGYMIQLAVAARDYRDGAISPVYDAYLDWKAHRDLSVRAGQHFVPFDRLRTIREWGLQMADRPRPVAELTLDRDVGATLYSDHLFGDSSPLAYRLGVFGGSGIHVTTAKEPGVLLVGRLELRPLGDMDDDVEGDLDRRPDPRVAIGGAFAANVNSNRARSTTGGTFAGGTTDFLHAATDLVFKWQGVALQAEYLWKQASDDAIESIDDEGEPRTEATRSAHGWVLQASYVFPEPIEVVGRLSRIIAHEGTDPQLVAESIALGQEVGAGLNYYVLGHRFKLQADWIARMPHDFEMSSANHVVHVQLDATF